MVFGFFFFVVGYALFYWGWHHFSGVRYSLWYLLGFGSLPGLPGMPQGTPLQWKTDQSQSQQAYGPGPSNPYDPGFPLTPNNVPQVSPPCKNCAQGSTHNSLPLGSVCQCGNDKWQRVSIKGKVQWIIIQKPVPPPYKS